MSPGPEFSYPTRAMARDTQCSSPAWSRPSLIINIINFVSHNLIEIACLSIQFLSIYFQTPSTQPSASTFSPTLSKTPSPVHPIRPALNFNPATDNPLALSESRPLQWLCLCAYHLPTDYSTDRPRCLPSTSTVPLPIRPSTLWLGTCIFPLERDRLSTATCLWRWSWWQVPTLCCAGTSLGSGGLERGRVRDGQWWQVPHCLSHQPVSALGEGIVTDPSCLYLYRLVDWSLW